MARTAVSLMSVMAMLGAQTLAAFSAPARNDATGGADYQACQVQTETEFRLAIEGITQRSLEKGLIGLDYTVLVTDQWRKGGIDQVIDRQVDEAIAQVKNEESWTDLLKSLGSKEKAQELGLAVAERVYKSEGFKAALEQAAADMGRDIGKRIEIATVDTATPAMLCMRAFLGPRYGQTVARAVGDDARREFEVDPKNSSVEVGKGQLILGSKEAIAGAVILLVRKQLANIAQRMGQRLVGSILSRIVSVAAGGVGLVLIAKDIWGFRNGVLPIIADEMKSKASKDKVQAEIANAVKEQMGDHVKEIAQKTAERVVDIWQDYRRAHAKVIEMSDKHPAFKAFLDTVAAAAMPKLDQMTSIVLASEGEAGLLARVADGSLNEAITKLPDEAVDIAKDTRSLTTALKWAALAGADLAKVHNYEIHRKAAPEDFTRVGLTRLLALDDRLAISRLTGLKRGAREALFELETGELKLLARALDEAQLASLSQYLTGLKREAADRVMRAVSRNPQKMQSLAKSFVRNAVLRSSDQTAAVNIVLRADSLFDFADLPGDIELVRDGRVSPVLLWEKHTAFVVIAALLALIVLRWLQRLLFWRPFRRSATAVPAGTRR